MNHFPVCEGVAEYLYWEEVSREYELEEFQAQCAYEHQRVMEDWLNQGGEDVDAHGEFLEMYLVTAHH